MCFVPDPAPEGYKNDTDLKANKLKVVPRTWISPGAVMPLRTSRMTGQRVKSQATDWSRANETDKWVKGSWTYIKPGFLWLLHCSPADHGSVFITAVSSTKKILEREETKKDLSQFNLGFNSKKKKKCDNHPSLVTVELRIRNRGATRGESFKFLIHGQLKTSHTADPKKRFAQQHPPLCLLLPPAAHNSPQNNPTGVAARCDQKFTS